MSENKSTRKRRRATDPVVEDAKRRRATDPVVEDAKRRRATDPVVEDAKSEDHCTCDTRKCTVKCPCRRAQRMCDAAKCHPTPKPPKPPARGRRGQRSSTKPPKCCLEVQYIDPPPTKVIDVEDVIIRDVDEAVTSIQSGQKRIVLFPLYRTGEHEEFMKNISAAVEKDALHVFDVYNNAVREEFQVPPPSVQMLLYPEKHVKEWQPYRGAVSHPGKKRKFAVFDLGSNGMLNYYSSKLSHFLIKNEYIAALFAKLNGEDWRVFPNRMRLQLTAHRDKVHSPHWEYKGKNLGTIISMSEERYFTYYDIDFSSDETQAYLKHCGFDKNFNAIPLHNIYKDAFFRNTRRRVRVPMGHVLLFDHRMPHEIDNTTPSFSVFLSPYALAERYQGDRDAPYVGKLKHYETPIEYAGLSVYEANNVGQLFGNGGITWPSRKVIYHGAHLQTMKNWVARARSEDIVDNKTVRYSLPRNGEFSMISNKEKLEDMGFVFPNVVYQSSFPKALINPLEHYADDEVRKRLGLMDTSSPSCCSSSSSDPHLPEQKHTAAVAMNHKRT